MAWILASAVLYLLEQIVSDVAAEGISAKILYAVQSGSVVEILVAAVKEAVEPVASVDSAVAVVAEAAAHDVLAAAVACAFAASVPADIWVA